MSMVNDPLVVYALQHGNEDASLIKIAKGQSPEVEAIDVFEQFRMAAEQGSPFAMCVCSRMSKTGKGTERSGKKAFKWAELAAATSFAPGLYELGDCHENVIGTFRDVDRAIHLYKSASDGGYGFAAFRLGMGYGDGSFGSKNYEDAHRYLVRADALGDQLAAFELAQWYESGAIVPQDNHEAVRWYLRASDIGNFFASHRLYLAYLMGDLGLLPDPVRAAYFEKRMQSQVGETAE